MRWKGGKVPLAFIYVKRLHISREEGSLYLKHAFFHAHLLHVSVLDVEKCGFGAGEDSKISHFRRALASETSFCELGGGIFCIEERGFRGK